MEESFSEKVAEAKAVVSAISPEEANTRRENDRQGNGVINPDMSPVEVALYAGVEAMEPGRVCPLLLRREMPRDRLRYTPNL